MVRSAPVHGQVNTSLRRLVLLVATASVVLAVPAVSGAGSAPATSSLRAQDAALAAKSRSAVLGLYSLDQQLAQARARLATLQSQLRRLRAERADVLARLRAVEATLHEHGRGGRAESGALALEYGIGMHEWIVRWCDDVERRLLERSGPQGEERER